MLGAEEDFAGLVRLSRKLAGQAEALDSTQRVVEKVEFPIKGRRSSLF